MDIVAMFYKSFGDSSAYANAIFKWRWKLAAYFFILSAISATISWIIVSKQVSLFFENDLPPIVKKLANVKISDWKVQTPNNETIEFKTADGEIYGIVTPNYVDATKTKGLIFSLEKDRLTFYAGAQEHPLLLKEISPEKKDFPAAETVEFYKAMVTNFLFPVIFLGAIFTNLIYVLILSFATYILSQTKMPSLGWVRSFKFSVIALTPALLTDAVCFCVFGFSIPAFALAIISVYIIFRVLTKLSQVSTETDV